MENVGNNLPQELVEEILTRLPCKSLIRFKCVCKHWYALVHQDTKFLSHHLSHFIKNQNSATNNDVLLKLSFCTYPKTGMVTLASKLFSLSATSHMHGMETPIPTLKSDSKLFEICGHSNGILCLSIDDNEQVLLCNPVTTEVRHLPAEPLESKSLSVDSVAVGMGYDSSISDFKVIRIRRRASTIVTWAEQYTLSTDSWTVLTNTKGEPFQFNYRSFAMCFKRTFYWWARSSEDYSHVILALNMDDEVFQIVPKPLRVDIDIYEYHARSLTVWNDSVSLICCTTSSVDIWAMAGFGSWSLMRTIKHPTRVVPKPRVFWKGNNELLIDMSNRNTKSYNVDTEEIKDVPTTKHTDGLINRFQAVNYVPSLVPLKRERFTMFNTCT